MRSLKFCWRLFRIGKIKCAQYKWKVNWQFHQIRRKCWIFSFGFIYFTCTIFRALDFLSNFFSLVIIIYQPNIPQFIEVILSFSCSNCQYKSIKRCTQNFTTSNEIIIPLIYQNLRTILEMMWTTIRFKLCDCAKKNIYKRKNFVCVYCCLIFFRLLPLKR